MYKTANMGTRIEIKQGGLEDDRNNPSISLQKDSEVVICDIDLRWIDQGGTIRVRNLNDQVTVIHPEPYFPGDVKDPNLIKPKFLTDNNQREIFPYKTSKLGHSIDASKGEVVITHFDSLRR